MDGSCKELDRNRLCGAVDFLDFAWDLFHCSLAFKCLWEPLDGAIFWICDIIFILFFLFRGRFLLALQDVASSSLCHRLFRTKCEPNIFSIKHVSSKRAHPIVWDFVEWDSRHVLQQRLQIVFIHHELGLNNCLYAPYLITLFSLLVHDMFQQTNYFTIVCLGQIFALFFNITIATCLAE